MDEFIRKRVGRKSSSSSPLERLMKLNRSLKKLGVDASEDPHQIPPRKVVGKAVRGN